MSLHLPRFGLTAARRRRGPSRPRAAASLLSALAASALLALSACGGVQTQGDGPPDGGDGPRSVRPDIVQHTLANGLKVYLVADSSAPLVSYQVWFKVGSVNEREAGADMPHGITGLSHFFEHMMFRGTEKYPDFFDRIYSMGAKLNAFTWLDETVYWENLPSEHLETVIDMEADRLTHMKVDFLNLEPEREVVKSERLLRTDNAPMGRAWELLQSRAFEVFPYHWSTIGWMRDLNAITVEEAQDYHSVYYAPNNAYVVVVGDIDPAKTLAWIEKAYGGLEAKDIPPEDFTPEPPQTAERRDRVVKPVEPPLVLVGFRAPAVADRDFMVLEVLDRVLGDGKSARLQKRLVHADEPMAARLFSYLFPIRHPYLHLWGINLMPNTGVEEMLEAFDEELARVAAEGVTAEEIARAVASLRSEVVRQNLSNKDKAEFIGWSLRTTDDPFVFFDRLEGYGTVTAEDLKRVAAAVLAPTNRTIVPVVDPARVETLAKGLADAKGMPAQVGELLNDATALLLARQQLTAARREQAMESKAIGLLEQRAERAKADADAETVEAIEAYMTGNEKGATKRRELLAAGQAESRATEGELEAKAKALAKQLRALNKRKWNPKRSPQVYALSLVGSILSGGPGAGLRGLAMVDTKSKGDDGSPVAPEQVAVMAAYDSLLAWILDERGLEASAQARRQRVLDATAGVVVAETDEASTHLEALRWSARALAYETQITGRTLEDALVTAEPPTKRSSRSRR